MTTESTSATNAASPLGSASSEGLGLAPERAGQPRMMTIIDGAQDDETGHWYSPAAVREMLAAERERWKAVLVQIRDDSWPDPDISAAEYACEVLNCGPNAGDQR